MLNAARKSIKAENLLFLIYYSVFNKYNLNHIVFSMWLLVIGKTDKPHFQILSLTILLKILIMQILSKKQYLTTNA